MDLEKIIEEQYEIEQRMMGLNKEYDSINSHTLTRLAHISDLKRIKSELQELKERREKLEPLLQEAAKERDKDKLLEKKVACEKLIEEVKNTKYITGETGEEEELSDEIKDAFIKELNNYMDNPTLRYAYTKEETDSYSIEEQFALTPEHTIDIVVVTKDATASNRFQHFKTKEEMLRRYMLYYNEKKKENEVTK